MTNRQKAASAREVARVLRDVSAALNEAACIRIRTSSTTFIVVHANGKTDGTCPKCRFLREE
jgi:hypothetical protein